jgi:uncharacterized membrane protein (UPF0127 family)
MKAVNFRNGEELSSDVELADSLFKRMKGLLGRKELGKGESLWIRPCNSIHTIGMKFPIDVLFLDKENMIVTLKKNILPNRISGLYMKAVSVLELPAGTLTATDTQAGDKIEIV